MSLYILVVNPITKFDQPIHYKLTTGNSVIPPALIPFTRGVITTDNLIDLFTAAGDLVEIHSYQTFPWSKYPQLLQPKKLIKRSISAWEATNGFIASYQVVSTQVFWRTANKKFIIRKVYTLDRNNYMDAYVVWCVCRVFNNRNVMSSVSVVDLNQREYQTFDEESVPIELFKL